MKNMSIIDRFVNVSIINLIVMGLVAIGAIALVLAIITAFDSSDSPSAITAPQLVRATEAAPEPAPARAAARALEPASEPAQARVHAPAPEPQELTAQVNVEPDPDYKRALAGARFATFGWKTDFSRHTVPYGDIISGGPPRDGIPPIDSPSFVSPESAEGWLGDQEPVIALELNGDSRAYPLQILTWHEIVNDEVGGVPVAVTFCPLCNSALVFDRRLDGVVYDFGTSGNLRNSDLIMWDRQTESWWQQLTGEGIVGELAGRMLTFLPAPLISFEDFKAASPDGKVRSRDTGYSNPYGTNPYAGYDRIDNPPFLYQGPLDGQLLPKERVATVTVGGVDAAFPFSVLEEEKAVNYNINGQDLVVFFKLGTKSALDQRSIKRSKDVGSTGLFDAHVDGRKLTFRAEDDRFVDNETGSVWTILGQAVEGPLAGEKLTPIAHGNHFWFAWGVFKPDTLIYQGMG